MNRKKFGLIVFLSGFSSMGFEILAGSLLRPIFGSSIFVWGSVIGAYLLGLGLGYYGGGRISTMDYSEKNILIIILFLLSFIIAISGIFGENIARAISIFKGVLGPVLPSLFLFSPVSFLFGAIIPIVIELVDGERGEVSGYIFFSNTFGGILGIYIVTFYLLPFQGLTTTIIILSFIPFVIGFIVYVQGLNLDKMLHIIPVLFLLIIVFSSGAVSSDDGSVVTERSFEKTIKVVDQEHPPYRYMVFDNGTIRQSVIDRRDKSRIVDEYIKSSLLPFLNSNDINNSLIIGGGGYIAPRAIHNLSNNNVTVIESDPKVYKLAKEKMYYNPEEYPNINTVIMDARRYIQQTDNKYDYYFMDAFNRHSLPPHLTTKEYYEEIDRILGEDGYLVVNIPRRNDFFRSEYKTIRSVFPNHNISLFSSNGKYQLVLIITKRELSKKRMIERAEKSQYNLSNIVGNEIDTSKIKTKNVPIITDNRNPSQIQNAWR